MHSVEIFTVTFPRFDKNVFKFSFFLEINSKRNSSVFLETPQTFTLIKPRGKTEAFYAKKGKRGKGELKIWGKRE